MALTTSYVNFRTCCRLCLTEDCALANIFSTRNQPSNLAEKIYSVIGIKVTNKDRISTNLCDKCFLYVNNYDNFKNICLINQEKLATQLSVYESRLFNESIQIKDEPLSDDDDVVFVSSQDESPLSVKVESQEALNNCQDDEQPPILSPNLPTAEMLRNLEVQTVEHVEELEAMETIDAISQLTSPNSNGNVGHAPAVEGRRTRRSSRGANLPEESFRLPDLPVSPRKVTNSNANDSRDKIDFAATLNLAKKMDNVNMEVFTRTEIQYSLRMRIIYTEMTTVMCCCHNRRFGTNKALLGHVKKHDGVCLPPYTCPNCCTTFNRSTFYRHRYTGTCNLLPFEFMYDVSNVTERGINKHRNYQAFKCKLCMASARLFQAYVQHVDDHILQDPDMLTCECGKKFSNTNAFKQHLLTPCVMKPSCDMCDIMFDTTEEFKQHCVDEHDDKEGEVFNLDESFKVGELPFVARYACLECNLKCKQELFLVRHLQKEHGYALEAAKRVGEDCYVGPALSQQQNGVNNHDMVENEGSVLEQPVLASPVKVETRSKGVADLSTDEKFMASAYRTISPAVHECQICFKTFSNVANVRRHLNQAHLFANQQRTSSFSCGNCDATFRTMQLLQNHLMSEHLHTCKECGKKCDNLDELDKHRSSHLKISLTRDPNTHNYRSSAGSQPDEMPLLQEMDMLDVKNLRMNCNFCNRFFATTRGLAIHVKRQHPESALQRDELTKFPQFCKRKGCHVLLNSVPDWSLHMQLHAEAGTASSGGSSPAHPDDTDYFTCKKCFKVFANKGNLKQHMKTHGVSHSPPKSIKGKRYFCSICKHVSTSSTEWAAHKQSHLSKTSLKGSVCKLCKVAFANTTELQAHMNTEHAILAKEPKQERPEHQGPFDCEVCGKRMPSRQSLFGHIGWHKRGDGDYVVGFVPRRIAGTTLGKTGGGVGKVGKKPNMLSINTEKLFKNKTFICITCGDLFPSKTTLQTHQTSAHGKLKCPTCWKYFRTEAELNEHMRTVHVKSEQPPQLTRPQLAAVKQESKKLKRGGYEYCKICGAEFTHEAELRDHMAASHPGIPFLAKGCGVCPICDDEFRSMAALASHVRMHNRRGETLPLAAAAKEQQALSKKPTIAKKIEPLEPPAVGTGGKKTFKFSCGICHKGYDLGPDLRRHIYEQHPF